jgi:hypothetical protein
MFTIVSQRPPASPELALACAIAPAAAAAAPIARTNRRVQQGDEPNKPPFNRDKEKAVHGRNAKLPAFRIQNVHG